MALSNQPPKGTSDWLPDEYAIRKYIFDTWRTVCERFGYKEYLTPIVESADIYRAKSGEDVGGKELMTMVDRAGRELAIRPEMTPSVTRMVSRIYDSAPKPIRLFSIANFLRNEKPQRGRNREFWQLNFDVFGSDSVNADIEILQMALEIMLSFRPPQGSFKLFVNNRRLIDAVMIDLANIKAEHRAEVVRTMDKWEKMELVAIKQRLTEIGVDATQIDILVKFMQSASDTQLAENLPQLINNDAFIETKQIIDQLIGLGYQGWVEFKPNVIRGFDYYDGMIFEVFDTHLDNNRSMFGGGRYNGLASLFGGSSFPAVGSAPGDETTRIFLESWNLLVNAKQKAETYYLPLLDESSTEAVAKLAAKLRSEGNRVEAGFEVQKLGKALEYASKSGVTYTVIFGDQEQAIGKFKLKNMVSGEEQLLDL
jgi:histidyl-tRNA synthetase